MESSVRILATADLHYDIWRSHGPTKRLARELTGIGADVLILAGDTAGIRTDRLGDCLDLFADFPGRKLLVPGNHCIWVDQTASSWEKYHQILPRIVRNHGFDYLDLHPVLIDHVAFVGNMGWYDYSFRDRDLGIPMRFYENKLAPGAAARLEEYAHLLEDCSDIPPQAAAISARWMDGEWVKWPFTDQHATRLLADRFSQHLAWADQKADTIVAVTHHLPFSQLLRKTHRLTWRFANAFMGSYLFGQAMLAQPKCRLAICGHSHRHNELTIDHLHCVSVGSTYTHKRYVAFDL